MDSFIWAHVHMYEFFDVVPTRRICDNLKTGVVSHPKKGEIVLTGLLSSWRALYNRNHASQCTKT